MTNRILGMAMAIMFALVGSVLIVAGFKFVFQTIETVERILP